MSYVKKNLLEGESVVHWGRTHWFIFIPSIIGFIFSCIVVIARREIAGYLTSDSENIELIILANIILAVVVFIPSIKSFITALVYKISTELAVTNKRIIAKFGLIKRNTVELNHSKVESFNVSQGILDRLFDSGTIIINGTGNIQTPIPNIDAPISFRNKAMEVIDDQGGQTQNYNLTESHQSKIEDNSHEKFLTARLGVAKTPFFPTSILQTVLGFLFNVDGKYNSGTWVNKYYSVNHAHFVDDLIYTSCDCRLAINVWSKSKQRIKQRLQTSNVDSYSTMLMLISQDAAHIIFGNGTLQFYSHNCSEPQKIRLPEFDFNSSVILGNKLFLYLEKSASLAYINLKDITEPEVHEFFDLIALPLNYKNYRSTSPKLHFLKNWGGKNYLLIHEDAFYNYEGAVNFYLLEWPTMTVVHSFKTTNLQAVEVQKVNKRIVILAKKLIIFDEHFTKTHSESIPSKSKNWRLLGEGNIAIHPSSNILIFSSPFNSGLYIFDMASCKMQKLEQKEFDSDIIGLIWSHTGRYLAAVCQRSKAKNNSKYLIIFDYEQNKIILYKDSYCFNASTENIDLHWYPLSQGKEELVLLENHQFLEWYSFEG